MVRRRSDRRTKCRKYMISLKVGSSHGLWQFKLSGTHDRVMMHGLRHILDKTCQLLGYNHADRSAVYLFYFSAEPFEGYQVCLEKIRKWRTEAATTGSSSPISVPSWQAASSLPSSTLTTCTVGPTESTSSSKSR